LTQLRAGEGSRARPSLGPLSAPARPVLAPPDPHPHPGLARSERSLRRLVQHELALDRAANALDLLLELLPHTLGLALEVAHAPAHPVDLLLELEHLLHSCEVHAQLTGELLDAAQALYVLLRVEARVLGRALGGDQPARLVDAQRLGVHAGQL